MKIILIEGLNDAQLNDREAVIDLAELTCGVDYAKEAQIIIGVSGTDAKCVKVSPFKTLPARPLDIEIAYEVV